jgi:putative effector of murein hydrolase
MAELLNLELTSVMVTLLAYRVGLLVQQKLMHPVFNPILIAAVLVGVFITVTGLPDSTYQAANVRLSWLLTPATVCLAIPMYEQLEILRKNLKCLLAGIAAGAVSCTGFVLLIALISGFDRALTVSLLPKFVTAAIGVPLSQLSGGIPSITTAVILLTGITGAVLGPTLCKLFKLEDEISRGVAFGTAGHVVATARASELSPLTGAVSSLSLVVAGLLAALVFPVILR